MPHVLFVDFDQLAAGVGIDAVDPEKQFDGFLFVAGQGKQKLKYVVSQARGLLPKWLQGFVTEEAMMKVIDKWFEGVKDLLDDGRVNGSQK